MWVKTTSAQSASRQGPCRPVFKKIAHLVGRLGSGSRLVGRIGSGVRVSASFQKHARLVGQLGSGPHLLADRADVGLDDRADVVFTNTP